MKEEKILSQLPPLIIDLAVILTAAAISTLIFKKFKQPIVLGYLIAGFAVGPHSLVWSPVVDIAGIKLWAEIGVIFLLFGLGLEFSFKKLAKVGKSASITAIGEVLIVSTLGYFLGRTFGWTVMDSLFLGAVLSISSTTIIIRAFDESGLKGKGFVNLVFGILIVEDLIAILLVVFLTAISGPGEFSGLDLVHLALRLGLFLFIWFLVGIYLLPSALIKIRSLLTSEIMLVLSLCLCLLMVVLASKAGFSAALGAFIMGSILAETREGERIEGLLKPVRDLFAAVFFVSVGMMIDPPVLRDYFGIIMAITVVTIVAKFLGSGLGAVLSGRSLKQSVQTGMSLAQIGEFSYIIATLGSALKVTSDFLYPVVIAVSAVTTFTTPYMIRYSGPLYDWVEKKLPSRIVASIHRFESAMHAGTKESALGLLWRIYGLSVLVNSMVVIAISWLAGRYLFPFLVETFSDSIALRITASILVMIACSPFLGALILKEPKKIPEEDISTIARLRRLQIGVVGMRLLLVFGLVIFIIKQFSSTTGLFFFVLIAASIVIFLLRKYLKPIYIAVERRFLANLNAKELAEMEKMAGIPELTPWHASLIVLTLPADSLISGLTLEEAKFRSTTGATVAMIDRGKRRIFAPKRSERLLPHDQLYLIGTEEQIVRARELIEVEHQDTIAEHADLYCLETVIIDEQSVYAFKSISEIAIGEDFGGLVVGIERNKKRILNPDAHEKIEPGDQVWIFGDRVRLRSFKKNRPPSSRSGSLKV